MSGRAVQDNIWFKAGSIGPTGGKANTEAKNPDLRSAMIYEPMLAPSIDMPDSSSGWKQ